MKYLELFKREARMLLSMLCLHLEYKKSNPFLRTLTISIPILLRSNLLHKPYPQAIIQAHHVFAPDKKILFGKN
jgi:hypothetical protein